MKSKGKDNQIKDWVLGSHGVLLACVTLGKADTWERLQEEKESS